MMYLMTTLEMEKENKNQTITLVRRHMKVYSLYQFSYDVDDRNHHELTLAYILGGTCQFSKMSPVIRKLERSKRNG